MKQIVNKKYQPVYMQGKRYFILMGGRGAGRSYSASQFALAKLTAPQYFRCAIMRYVLGDIRNSIFQDILDRAEETEVLENLDVRDHLLNITYGANKITGLGFKKSSSDQKAKLKSLANYNYVIIEEADEVAEEDFMQLDDSIRTLKADIKIIMLLNPPNKNHWIIKRWFHLDPSPVEGFYKPVLRPENYHDTVHIHTTYLDNKKNISASTASNYERYKTTRPEHYYNMIRGLVSEGARGRIFSKWKRIPDAEFEALPYVSFYGLDFGFTNDPTALVELKQHNLQVWARELIYEPGLTNRRISERLGQLGVSKEASIFADSAEPKSIAEIAEDGWNIMPSVKGQDSINAGVDMLLGMEVCYTESSKNIDTESLEYKWALDKNKEPTNDPIDEFNHGMDAIRYGVFTKNKEAFVGFA